MADQTCAMEKWVHIGCEVGSFFHTCSAEFSHAELFSFLTTCNLAIPFVSHFTRMLAYNLFSLTLSGTSGTSISYNLCIVPLENRFQHRGSNLVMST